MQIEILLDLHFISDNSFYQISITPLISLTNDVPTQRDFVGLAITQQFYFKLQRSSVLKDLD